MTIILRPMTLEEFVQYEDADAHRSAENMVKAGFWSPEGHMIERRPSTPASFRMVPIQKIIMIILVLRSLGLFLLPGMIVTQSFFLCCCSLKPDCLISLNPTSRSTAPCSTALFTQLQPQGTYDLHALLRGWPPWRHATLREGETAWPPGRSRGLLHPLMAFSKSRNRGGEQGKSLGEMSSEPASSLSSIMEARLADESQDEIIN
jgi:hypothetical protein